MNFLTKVSFLAVIAILLTVPMIYPEYNWTTVNQGFPIPILNSQTGYDISTNDWPHAMQWLKENTPDDAVIAAWWDYGYWISTLGERKTVADGSTLLDWQIKKIASAFMSTPNDAWKILSSDAKTDVSQHFVSFPITDSSATNGEERKLELFAEWKMQDKNRNGIINSEEMDGWYEGAFEDDDALWKTEVKCDPTDWQCEKYQVNPGKISQYSTLFDYWETEVYTIEPTLTGLDADYIIVNLAVEKLPDENIQELYTLPQKGGDESKAFWFMKIADLNISDYYNRNMTSYTDEFWDETLLGKLIPFTVVAYVDPDNTELQSETFQPGYVALYVADIKFTTNTDSPFELVYVPPSFEHNNSGPLTGPLIYKINKDYNPNQ